MAKYDKRDLAEGDRICMRKDSPVKEGTVRAFDEEQAFIVFDDMKMGWVHLGHFFITAKGADIAFPDGTTWFEYSNRKREGE